MTSDRFNEACAYFESCFDGTQSDEEVMSELGDPKHAAKLYYGGYVESRAKKKGVKNRSFPKGLIIALVLVILPFIVPTALAAAAALFVLCGIVVALIALLPVSTIAMWIGGAGMFLAAFAKPVILVDKLMQMGWGLVLCGAGLILTWLIVKWYLRMFPAIIRGIVSLGQALLKKFSNGDEE
jgi:uncharacterized membrane protein